MGSFTITFDLALKKKLEKIANVYDVTYLSWLRTQIEETHKNISRLKGHKLSDKLAEMKVGEMIEYEPVVDGTLNKWISVNNTLKYRKKRYKEGYDVWRYGDTFCIKKVKGQEPDEEKQAD